MSKHPLAIVCALAFVAGGASAFVLEYPTRDAADVRDVTAGVGDVGRASAESEAAEARTAEAARPEEMTPPGGDSSEGAVSVEPPRAAGVKTGGPAGRERGRALAGGRAVEGSRATRGHAVNSGTRTTGGGRGVTGLTVGGVKKTGAGVKKAGAAIGRTFGKVGGVFND